MPNMREQVEQQTAAWAKQWSGLATFTPALLDHQDWIISIDASGRKATIRPFQVDGVSKWRLLVDGQGYVCAIGDTLEQMAPVVASLLRGEQTG